MNQELEKAIHIATQIADEHRHASFGPAHLIKAILNRDLSLLRYLHDEGVDVYFIEEWADVNLETYPKRSSRTQEVKASSEAKIVFVEAENLQQQLNKSEVDLICVFIAAITPGVGFSFDQLKALPLSSNELLEREVSQSKGGGETKTKTNLSTASASESGEVLKKYTKNLIVKAKDGLYDHIVNRDRELKMIAEIVSRKSKPNVIVQGESGVGKTVLIENLALEIQTRRIVDTLKEAEIFEIDIATLLSGASYKGEIEDRLQNLFNEARSLTKPIAFIDDLHTLLQEASSSQGILNVIKSELNKGEVIIIGATTSDSYRKHIAIDDALNRRFESVLLEEPDHETAFRILKSVAKSYTEHHILEISDNSLREAIRLAKRYLKEKSLPDSALDLIDRTMAAANVSKQSLPGDLAGLHSEVQAIEKKLDKLSADEKNQEIDWVYMAIKNRLSPIVLGKFDTENGFAISRL